jgi:hypothetical protein
VLNDIGADPEVALLESEIYSMGVDGEDELLLQYAGFLRAEYL